MQRKPRILAVGSFVMDVIATTERIPPAGQTVYGREFHMAPGGKGANQALQCARLGAEVTMMGCVGDDLFGEKLLEPLRAAGIHLDHVAVHKGVSSGVGHVTLEVMEHTAQNRIVVIPGANQTLKLEEISWLREEIGSYDLVLLKLWDKGVEHIVITLGGHGAVVVKADGLTYIPCVSMRHVADPTAAGDSFVGALAVGVTLGLSHAQALEFAAYTAALTVSRMGAMPSLPTLEEVLTLMRERGCQAPARLDVLKA